MRWIRVPRGRRTKSISGVESQVGQAAGEAADEGHQFVGEPPVEIEFLIVPAISEMHDAIIAQCKAA